MRDLAPVLGVLLLCAVCGAASQTLDEAAQPPKSYSCHGVVQQLDVNQRRVTIHHQEVPGYMPEMTMDFDVKNTNELTAISSGSEVTFDLLVQQRDAWIENLRCIHQAKGPSVPASPSDVASFELKAGDGWPDGELLAEDGRRIHFSDFRGRALAITFFFIRCPLPDYCPRLNRSFAEAHTLLAGAQSNYVFLSVSFDPDFDTPGLLTSYAKSYRADSTNQWLFAVAPPQTLAHLPRRLGLSISRLGGGITHNLRTVVLAPDGKVYRQFDGNNWTGQDLANAMQQANKP
jgi:protein SCO1/2